MSDGESLLRTIRYMRELHEQLALLLSTADALMAGNEFEQGADNTCVFETSGSIQFPKRWMPNEVFRFYVSARYPRVLAFLTIMLDDRGREYRVPLTEPVVATGAFIGMSEVKNWDWWWARWHGYMPDRRDDGTVAQAEVEKSWPGDKYPFQTVITVAKPLVQLRDSQDLTLHLVDPLIRALGPKYEPEASRGSHEADAG